jgi:hypothetical protein
MDRHINTRLQTLIPPLLSPPPTRRLCPCSPYSSPYSYSYPPPGLCPAPAAHVLWLHTESCQRTERHRLRVGVHRQRQRRRRVPERIRRHWGGGCLEVRMQVGMRYLDRRRCVWVMCVMWVMRVRVVPRRIPRVASTGESTASSVRAYTCGW